MTDSQTLTIGGAPVVTLERPEPADPSRPAFLRAQVLPGRGMMTLQVTAHLPGRGAVDLLASPPPEGARIVFDGTSGEPFPGNASYLLGGALLIPYANRIRGQLAEDGRTVAADVLGRTVHLPANAGGRRPGAERYAMHGLILDTRVDDVRRDTTPEADAALGTLHAGDFGHGWPSSTDLQIENVLRGDSFTLTVTATNAGDERLPVGIGWHPYFAFPSGLRQQGRLRIPARERTLVNDYDEVLPTGEIVPVAGTPYDFTAPGGRALGDLFLDDCFVDLHRTVAGETTAEVTDPAAGYGLRIVTASPPVQAVQVYAPPDRPFVCLEPQLNWADPFGPQWPPGADTGMAVLAPGESTVYSVRLELFVPADPGE